MGKENWEEAESAMQEKAARMAPSLSSQRKNKLLLLQEMQ